jgi:hypothetical protein
MAKKNEVINKKVYTFEIIEYADGSSTMNRINDGFTPMELMGNIEFIKSEIIDQIKGFIKPTRVTRKVVKKDEK